MKQLKLEVGKTYLSRNGKEVKIVRDDDGGKYPCQGNNGEWYTASGKWRYHRIEDPEDLVEEVEEVPATRHTFDIPDGVKRVTVERVGNRIVVEMVPEKEPKAGDVMVNEYGNVYIFKEVAGKNTHKYYCSWLGGIGHLAIGDFCTPGRPATPEEAQPLFDALKKAGKRWNPEAMQVEDVPERDRIMDFLKGCANNVTWSYTLPCWLIDNYLKHKECK